MSSRTIEASPIIRAGALVAAGSLLRAIATPPVNSQKHTTITNGRNAKNATAAMPIARPMPAPSRMGEA